jgi:ectoine hydroxylase-related dioxygenase (phytanoyl-CoA dioxygenase family)
MNHSNTAKNALADDLPCYPRRMLTADELRRYKEDGVVLLKGAIEPSWVAVVERGIEESFRDPSLYGKIGSYAAQLNRKYRGFHTDLYMWKRIDTIRDAIYYGPFARWAQQIMETEEVRFFVDQVFVKRPGTELPTPWHQDVSFLPIRGTQICAMWMPVDRVKKENGVVFVKGSHAWREDFKAFMGQFYSTPLYVEEAKEEVPDINANPGKYEILSWDTEPGDILLFHIRTLHGAHGNHAQTTRRALALKWTGDDVVYEPSRGAGPNRVVPYRHSAAPGGPLRGPAFPRILPTYDPEERRAREHREGQDLRRIAEAVWRGAVTVGRRLASGRRPVAAKQTWDRCSTPPPSAGAAE